MYFFRNKKCILYPKKMRLGSIIDDKYNKVNATKSMSLLYIDIYCVSLLIPNASGKKHGHSAEGRSQCSLRGDYLLSKSNIATILSFKHFINDPVWFNKNRKNFRTNIILVYISMSKYIITNIYQTRSK